MKKSRIFSALLVLALLSTCVIGGTFAKYTSTSTGNDTARIAKWGFNAPASLTIELFNTNYTHVASGDSTNVVAPGTEKTAIIKLATVTGTAPEVDYTYGVTLTATDTKGVITRLDALDGWKWTYKGPTDSSAAEYATFAELQAAVNKNENVTAGNLPIDYSAGSGDKKIEIGWAWAYETGSDPTTIEAKDGLDTALGNDAAAGDLADFTIKLTVGATQID